MCETLNDVFGVQHYLKQLALQRLIFGGVKSSYLSRMKVIPKR